MKQGCPGHSRTRLGRRTFLKGSAAATAGLFTASRSRLSWAQPHPLIVDVSSVPVPQFTTGNRHPGVEVLLRTLACSGVPFYQADASYPLSDPVDGFIAPDDIVLVKINGQWQYRGVTNSDVVRGVIQRVLEHPEGFNGEVVIIENGQNWGSLNCDRSWPGTYPDNQCHANAEDESHSFQYLIDEVFRDPRVTGRLLDPFRDTLITADDHVTDGYRRDGFVSYPCFTTDGGVRVELKEGIWNGSGHARNLKLLNIPVYKDHDGCAITGALKHVYGILSMAFASSGYHYSEIGRATGDMHSLILPPTLHIVDCIWVSPGALAGWPADQTSREDRLLGGLDPVALDYYAGKYILYPAGGRARHDPDTSSMFRSFLMGARDQINGNLGEERVTFDESAFNVVASDASASPAGTLSVVKQGDGVRLEWEGGAPPYRVWRSRFKDRSSPELLTDCCLQPSFVDPTGLSDADPWFYFVE